jgi:hypothetical protein
MKDQDVLEAAVEYFASRSHNAWRRQFMKAHPREAAKPRMRQRGGEMVDINQPWKSLHPKAKADNKVAAYDAYQALIKHPKDREAASDYVHKRWIARNRRDPNQPKDLFKPYAALPEAEKDKDRAHVDNMKAALAAVKKKTAAKRPVKKTAKKAAAKTKARANGAAPHAFTLDAQTAKRLDAVAKRLSKTTGHKVTAEHLVLVGMQAMLALYEAAAPKS